MTPNPAFKATGAKSRAVASTPHWATMIRAFLIALAAWSLFACAAVTKPEAALHAHGSQVVLLHGLARSADSMKPLAEHLQSLGYETCNVSYPSTKHTVEILSANYVLPSIRKCFPDIGKPISFVTHSLGGIIVRQLAHMNLDLNFGRVVMLAPPNHGSEVVDKLGGLWLFHAINGPAGVELGSDSNSLPNSLGPAQFEVGVITGDFSINLILSTMIKGEDDGKVSIESAKLEGMSDFRVVSVSHPFIMKNHEVWGLVVNFLDHGAFSGASPNNVMERTFTP